MSKRYRVRFPVFAFLVAQLLLSVAAVAADKVLDVGQAAQSPVSLTAYFDVLEDPGQALTLADVQKPDIAQHFKASRVSAVLLNYGLTRSAYWMRLHLSNASDHSVERILEIAYPQLSNVQFHQPLADGTYR